MRRFGWLIALMLAAAYAAHAQPYPNKPIRAIVRSRRAARPTAWRALVGAHFTKVFRPRPDHREHGRRDRLDRIARDREGGAGRLHHHVQHQLDPFGQRLSLQQPRLRPDRRLHAASRCCRARRMRWWCARTRRIRPFRDFVAFAKANPDKLNFGYRQHRQPCGRRDAQCVRRHQDDAVSYRGTPQVTTDLLGGQIEFA